MSLSVELVRGNLARAAARIDAARIRGGWDHPVRLVVATKYVDLQDMAVLRDVGVRLVGENRSDELERKWRCYGDAFEYHFIGHLQHRKVRQVLPYVTMIHSVESLRLVRELDARADGVVDVLLEVNVSGEESKNGILPDSAEAFLVEAAPYSAVRFVGFMTMAPLVSDPEAVRPVFAGLRQLRDRLAPVFASRFPLFELSMGMSNDFEEAVEEGATMVRLGSTLFSRA